MKNIKNEKGAISAIVLVTLLLFVIILSGTYMINANIRKAQIKSQMQLKNDYYMSEEEKNEIYEDYLARNTVTNNEIE